MRQSPDGDAQAGEADGEGVANEMRGLAEHVPSISGTATQHVMQPHAANFHVRSFGNKST